MTTEGDIRRRAGRRLWIGIPGPALDAATERLLDDIRPGGVVLFRRNIESAGQARALVRRLREIAGEGLLVPVDQEGGLVVRFHKELTVFPGNMALGAAAYREPALGEHLGEEQGFHAARELRDLGIDVNLAPVLDLATRGANPGCGIRSFGAVPELAARLGTAFVRGTRRGGVHPCLKHFPGLGEASVDSHLDLPVIDAAEHEPQLAPFRAGIEAGAPLVMTSHVVYRAIDADRPATLSAAVVGCVLRGRLGFGGAVMTDDLEMGAMSRNFGFDGVVRGAAAAGHDVLCVCHSPELQRRAHDLLAEALAGRESWYGDPDAVDARLDRLRRLPEAGAPDCDAAARVAEAIAGRAVTVVRDDRRLLPLRKGQRVLLAMPTLCGETQAENPLRGEEDGMVLAEALGAGVEVHTLPAAPDLRDVDALLLRAQAADRLLVVLTNARFLPAQADLARRAVEGHPSVIFLPIRSPFDLEVVPAPVSHTAVVTYGFRPVQLRALAQVLQGRVEAYGRLPVTLRPLASP